MPQGCVPPMMRAGKARYYEFKASLWFALYELEVAAAGHNVKKLLNETVLKRMRFPIVSQIYRQGTLIVTAIALVFAFIFVIQHMTYTQTSASPSGSIRDAVDQALESINIRLRGRISPISSEYNLLDLEETDPRLAELAAEKCTIGKYKKILVIQNNYCIPVISRVDECGSIAARSSVCH